jgi:hypothetical protein
MRRGVPFPLFSDADRHAAVQAGHSIESTPAGRAIVARIIEKTSVALICYLSRTGGRHSAEHPGRYVTRAIRSDLSKQVGADNGYRLKAVSACPNCLASGLHKTLLVEYGPHMFSCPHCRDNAVTAGFATTNNPLDTEATERHRLFSKFECFSGITCVCPNALCKGKFIPIEFGEGMTEEIVSSILAKFRPVRGIVSFKEPPEELDTLSFKCPFCSQVFTPLAARRAGTGFKDKGGLLTGVPSVLVWEKTTHDVDDSEEATNRTPDMAIGMENSIAVRQKAALLVEDLLLHQSGFGQSSVSSLLSWYFCSAVLKWIRTHPEDAVRYFFCWSTHNRDLTAREMQKYPGRRTKVFTNVARGEEVSVHQAIFQAWMDELENGMDRFRRLDSGIRSLADLKWFCRQPKYSGGPKSTFRSEVDQRFKIPNRTTVVSLDGGHKPRLARILSIYRLDSGVPDRTYNHVRDIEMCEWHAVRMKRSSVLKPGDKVRVEALVMPGHHTHAPIQRIIRLRTTVLHNTICRILEEEQSGIKDSSYWNERSRSVAAVRSRVEKFGKGVHDGRDA